MRFKPQTLQNAAWILYLYLWILYLISIPLPTHHGRGARSVGFITALQSVFWFVVLWGFFDSNFFWE